MPKRKKLALIGLDSLVPPLVEKFVREGTMPAVAELMKRGAWGPALPSLPTHTPTNWTTIATGADPMIHGVVEFNYDSKLRRAEPIWRTAERHGRRSILLRYPGTWPRDVENAIVFEHGGNLPSKFRVCIAQCYLAGEAVKYVGGHHGTQNSMAVELVEARGWKGIMPSSPPPLSGEISIRTDDDRRELLRLHLLVSGARGRYSSVAICKKKDARTALCTLRVGAWSDFIRHPFRVKGKVVEAAFRFKLMALSPDGKRMRLHRSEVYPTSGFSHPEGITEELTKACGPYVGTPGRIPLAASWMDTYFEEAKDQVDWLARAARYLFSRKAWDIFMMECHFPDFIAHKFYSYIDPMSDEYDARRAREGWAAFRTAYELADRLVGEIWKAAGDDCVVVVVSDHGHCLKRRGVLVANALAEAGLFDPDNPEKSKVRIRGVSVFVNARSNQERERIKEQVITALLSIRDEETGVSPVAFALRRDEASLIGLGGDRAASPREAPGLSGRSRVGDVVLALRAGYEEQGYAAGAKSLIAIPSIGKWGAAGGTHGTNHPASTYSLGDIKAFFLIAGPGVKKGARLSHPIWLRDVAPTACHLIGMPAPANSNGSVVMQAVM